MPLLRVNTEEQCLKVLPKPARPEQSIVEVVEALACLEATANLSDIPGGE